MKLKILTSCLLFAFPVLVIAGPPVTKWKIKKPFEQKVFIENKGQFAIPGENVSAGDVTYAAHLRGLNYYFTKNNIWITEYTGVKRSDAEIAELKQKMGEPLNAVQEKQIEYKPVEHYYQMNFAGANTSQITATDEVSYYYTYGTTAANSIKANAYKKLIYTNLYPGIDMEVFFPSDTTGFEYSFIVHPGADPSQIKIQYPLNKGISLDEHGNLVVKGDFSDFIEHLPVANQAENSGNIKCSFVLNNGTLQIKPGRYNTGNTLKIDPWVNPTISTFLTGNNAAYVVDWDNGSNCYAYGGGCYYVGNSLVIDPWQLMKFNPSGTELWTYTENFNSADGDQLFGDFAVDRYAKEAYVCEGFNTAGSIMVKLNSGGTVLWNSNNTNMSEMWRISFSRCVPHEAVIGGGSNDLQSFPDNTAIALTPADSNLTGLTPVNVYGSGDYIDVCLLALDDKAPSPNAYLGFCNRGGGDNMVKANISTLTTVDWNKPNTNYGFLAGNTVQYAFGNGGNKTPPNGFEGMTYSELDDLYTYDSYQLERWNTTSGTLEQTQAINTPKNGNSSVYWGGLGSNNCNDIFLGTTTNIQEYDSSLAKVGAAIAEGDTVYSVKLGNYNLLYACGQDFVTVIQLDIPFCIPYSLDTTIINATCTTPGSFKVTPTGGTANYNYILYNSTLTSVIATQNNQSGTTTFSNLQPGTYVLDATDTSCLAERIYSTFTIVRDAIFSPGKVTPNPTAICIGGSVQLTATLADTYSWRDTTLGYPTGLSDSSGAVVTANPTATTTYFCIARTPPDCPDTIRVVVVVNPLPQVAVSPSTPAYCTGGSILLTASGASTYTWAPSAGLSASSGTSVTANGTATAIYTVTGTDGNGCVNDTTVTVTVNPYPIVSFTPDSETICNGKSTALTATGATTYTWQNNPSGLSDTTSSGSASASPAITTTYTVYGTTNGCTTAAEDTVTVLPLPTVAITALGPLYCINAAAVTLNGGGTPAGGTFTGTGVSYASGDTTFNPAAAGAGTFPITYTYTNAAGCTNSTDTMVTVAPLPIISYLPNNPVICSGLPLTLTAEGALTYTWSPSTDLSTTVGATVIATPTSPTQYTITGIDSNGCTNDTTLTVNIGTLPDTGFVMNVPSQCNSLDVQFMSTDTVSGTTYLWNFGDGTTSSAMNPAHNYVAAGKDTVKLYLTNIAGCEDSTIHPESVTSPAEQAVFPNAFTPYSPTENAKSPPDAENETFKPVINCNQINSTYLFNIYNRWGQLIFTTNDPTKGWDGTYNGGYEPVGVYVYYMDFTCGDCPTKRQGNVTLLR